MNRKIFISMLVLCIAFLSGLYFVKILFPDQFVMVVSNTKYLAFGEYVDNHRWLYHILSSATSFITYWLYLCATCRQKRLTLKQIVHAILAILITKLVYLVAPQFGMHVSICCMLILPALHKANSRDVAIVYSVHGLAQILSLEIRNLPLRVDITNYAVSLILIIECYFWLGLFYTIFNYKKEN